jgi:hypothetical protein
MKALVQKSIHLDRGWREKIVLFYLKNKISYKVLRKYAELTPL